MSKKNKKGIKLGVKQKILIPIILINIVVCVTIGVVLGSRMRTMMIQMAADQAITAAKGAASRLDGDLLPMIERGDEGTPEYEEVIADLIASRDETGMLYVYTLTTDERYVYYGVEASREEGIGTIFEESYEFMKPAFRGEIIRDETIYRTDDGILITCYVPVLDSSGNVVSVLGCDYDAYLINRKITYNIVYVLAFTLAGLAALILVSVRKISKVIRPLDDATQIAEKIRQCDLERQGEIQYSDDEIGELTRSFVVVADSLQVVIQDVRQQLDTISQGNFQEESACPEAYIGGYEYILKAINNIRMELNESMHKVRTASSQIAEGANQIADGAQSLSMGSSQQAATVEELSGNMDDMARQIAVTAKRAQEAAALSAEADAGIQDSNQHMEQFTDAMLEIGEYSKQIQNIIQTIDDIAFQTNILALNAAVEAARAGAAGKGFAVVADEVRNLAQKSAEAAKSTADLIDATTRAIRNSDEMAGQVADYLRGVAEKSARSKKRIQEISEVSAKQAEGAEQINEAIGRIAEVIQSNSALSQETAATCQELSAQADSLQQMLHVLKLKE